MRRLVSLVAAAVLAVTAGCGGTPVAKETVDAQRSIQERAAKDELNPKLSAIAATTSCSDQSLQQEYPVGAGNDSSTMSASICLWNRASATP